MLLVGIASLAAGQASPLEEPSRADCKPLGAIGYEPLFDGTSLEGWTNPYDGGEATVVDGEIHLVSDSKFFLVTERSFSDFRLLVDIHLPEGPANSGVMFRCHVEPNRVFGYQAECDGSERRWSGGLYDEGRRRWIWPSLTGRSDPQFLNYEKKSQAHFAKDPIRNALRRNRWNRYEITCSGDRIVIKVNGVKITDRRDSLDRSGRIGIQHHGEKGQVYRFRNLYIKQYPVVPARGNVELVEQEPISLEPVGSGTILIDYGRVAFGNLRVTPPAGAETPLTVRFGEKLLEGRVDRNPPGTVRYAEATAEVSPGEPCTIAPPAERRNSGLSFYAEVPPVLTPEEWGVVTPFRWVEIEGLPAGVSADRILRQAAFPRDWDDDAAAFECSDPTLNKVWDLCRYSIKATAFAGVYVDGDRERIPYEADAYLNQLSHYYAEGDTDTARRTIDWLFDHPTWPTEWRTHFVFMAHADWMQTGDAEWLKPRYACLKTKTLADRIGPSGLVESDAEQVRRTDLVDWPPSEQDDYARSPINTVVNAFHIAAVEKLITLAEAVGAEDDAKAYTEQAAALRRAFHREFFDASKGLYRDGVGVTHNSLHANFFPLAFGLVPPEQRKPIAAWLADRGMRCSVYGAQYLLGSLFEQGAGEAAVALITAPGDRSWRHLLDAGATITWEAWDEAYKPNLDWNHAWGAAPANLLPRYLLGVQPLTAGWDRVSIRPKPSGLASARGKVPSPHGPIRIDWTRDETFRLRVTTPDGVAAAVRVPVFSPKAEVRVDGEPVAVWRENDEWVLPHDLVGEHTIEAD